MQQQSHHESDLVCFHIIVTGFVQGVGFRPFVFRQANELAINGWVSNNTGQVSIAAEASRKHLELFCQRLITQAPAHAKPVIQSITEIAAVGYEDFSIKSSAALSDSEIHILADLATCDQCIDELFDRHNRRYLYPFINCTQCGPRNSIITALPYDRNNTSMQGFKLCMACEGEYTTPSDRRFHAEPVACECCGPQLTFVDNAHRLSDNRRALEACLAALKQGLVVAVKNIGGYHLMCDATSKQAVALLRSRKQRADKPFAILLQQSRLDDYLDASDEEVALLQQSSRPIVLIKRNSVCRLPHNIAPGFDRVGVMLPGNPLQHLICHYFQKPLVATSANMSGEPIITDNADATERLQKLCDGFLHHNRPIVRPADDAVMMVNSFGTQIIRSGRGFAPTEFTLPFTLAKPVLAVGGHIKNTIALAWKNRMVMSAHNGDLTSLRSYQTFKQAIDDLQQLYQVTAEHVICDAHPHYGSTLWASESGLGVSAVFHHHAHASSLALDYPGFKHWLLFAWDGVGMGVDGTLWGGETFLGGPGNWQRVVSFKPFKLPGGDQTARQAWRVAASLCWHSGLGFDANNEFSEALKINQLKTVWEKNINSPESSAVGRLFSAAASLLGLVNVESFEGHAPMLLEALAQTTAADAIVLAMGRDDSGIARIDWQPLVIMLSDTALTTAYRARCFHETLAECISRISLQYAEQYNDLVIGFSGGVFQNRLLVELIKQRLDKHEIKFCMPSSVPLNDGGLSAGQIIEYHYQ